MKKLKKIKHEVANWSFLRKVKSTSNLDPRASHASGKEATTSASLAPTPTCSELPNNRLAPPVSHPHAEPVDLESRSQSSIGSPPHVEIALSKSESESLKLTSVSISPEVPRPQIIINRVESADLKHRMSTDKIQNSILDNSTDFDKLKNILKKKLKDDEYEEVFRTFSVAQNSALSIAESLVKAFKAKIEVPETEQRRMQKKERALSFFEKIAKIGDVAVQHHPDIVALAWAGFRTLLQVAVDQVELRKLIETAEEAIVAALEVCSFYEQMYASSTSKLGSSTLKIQNALIELYAAVIVFCIKSKKVLESSNITTSIVNTFTSVNMEFRDWINEIEAKGGQLQKLAGMATIEAVMNLIKVQEATLERQEQEDLRGSRIWLGGLEIDTVYQSNKKLHTPGTSEWILEHSAFNRWVNGEVPTLLIQGIPGAGKSVLQSFILQKLPGMPLYRLLHPPILYFFFKNGDPKTESLVAMAATFIDQFIQQHETPRFVQCLNKARRKSNAHQCGNFNQLWALLMELVEAYASDAMHGPISILVDALDECSDRVALKEFLDQIRAGKHDWRRLGVKFLLTTRPEDDILRAISYDATTTSSNATISDHTTISNDSTILFNDTTTPNVTNLNLTDHLTINLEGELVNRDIIRFVEQQIAPGTEGHKKLQSFKELIVQTLPEKAQGMFRYASLMLDQLMKPSTRDVKKVLASIPSGLSNIYVWILEHLGDDPNELLLRKVVLAWVAVAFVPVTVTDIALAYVASEQSDDNNDNNDSEFDPWAKILINTQDILRVCGPLIQIHTSESGKVNTVSFSHFTVKEFLLGNQMEKFDRTTLLSKGPLVTDCLISDVNMVHRSILRACMRLLLSNSFFAKTHNDLYVGTHWLRHAMHIQADATATASSTIENVGNEQVADPDWRLVCKFLSDNRPNFANWLGSFPFNPDPDFVDKSCLETSLWAPRSEVTRFRQSLKSFHIIASFDLRIPLLEAMHDVAFEKEELECRDSRGNTPLYWAIKRSNLYLIKLLLQKGVNVDSKDLDGETPLRRAVAQGSAEIVKLLLEEGANVASQDKDGKALLHHAAAQGFTDVVKLLLEAGANVASQDEDGETPLHRAATQGFAEIVKLLLEAGANVTTEDKNGQTPLYCVIWHRSTEVAKLLLEAGANVSSQDKDGETPLQRAAAQGSAEIVKLLLEAGANLASQDNDGQTPLHRAAGRGSTEIVKLLLEAGANVASQDKDGKTPLHHATFHLSIEVAKLLLEAGAKVDDKDVFERTPLNYYAANGIGAGVELLLGQGAEVDQKDVVGRTPLSWAVVPPLYLEDWGAVLRVLELLVEKGAVIDTRDKAGRTPLSYAAEVGFVGGVEFLLKNGADVKIKDNFGKTAITWAKENRHTKVIKLLQMEKI